MNVTISLECQAFVTSAVASGAFHDEAAVVDEALRLLERREAFRRDVDLGTRQLKNGEYTEYDDKTLRQLFDKIRRDGRLRLARERNALR